MRAKPLVAAAAIAAGLSVALAGFAAFSGPPAAQANGFSGGVLAQPGSPAATGSTAPVTVSWTAAALTGGDAAPAQSYTVERFSGSGVDLGAACGGGTTTTLSCQDSPSGDGIYEYAITAPYDGWSTTSGFTNTVSLPPDAPISVALANGGGQSNSYVDNVNASHCTVRVSLDAGSTTGDTVTLTASDADDVHTITVTAPGTAGTGAVQFHNLDVGSFDDGPITFSATVTDGGGVISAATTTTVGKDTSPPVTTIAINPATPTGASGWYATTPTFTLSASDSSSGVATTMYEIGGGPATTYTGSPVSIPDGSGQTLSYWSTDNAGNVETANTSAPLMIDTAGPTDALSLTAATGAYYGAPYLYFKGNAAGSFRIVDSVSDSGSGPASASFPAISAAGWTHAAETVGTGSGSSPTIGYTSSAFSWTAAPASPSGYTVTGADVAGNASTVISPTFVDDTTAPVGGALTVNGTAASGAGTSSYSSSTSFAIGSRADFAETQSVAQSGLASSTLRVQSFPLSSNTCGPTASGPFAVATTISGTTQPGGFVTGYCYVYSLAGLDNVGNAASVQTTVMVDTTTPSTPALTFSGLSANAYYGAAFNALYFRPAAGGAYTVTASSTDSTSGIASYTYSGLSGNGFTATQSGGQNAYAFDGSATQPSPAPTVFATNNAGLDSASAAYNLVADTTAPSGGALTVNGSAASAAGSSSYSTTASFSIGSRSNYGETQSASRSGLASSTLTVQSFALAANTCGAAAGPFASPSVVTGTTQPVGIVTGYCYLYALNGTDNVGNSATVSTTVMVDATPPSAPAPTLSAATGQTYINGSTVYMDPQAGKSGGFTVTSSPTDPETGIANVIFPSLSGFTSGGGTVASGPSYSTTYAWSGAGATASGAQTITDTNNAGGTSTSAFSVTRDTAAPTGGAFAANSVAATTGGATAYATGSTIPWGSRTDYVDSGSGINTSTLTVQSASLSGNTCGSYGTATTLSGTSGSQSVSADNCYRFVLTGTDNVGNASSISVTVIVTGTPTQLAFSSQPAGGVTEGQSFTTSPAVSVEDAAGNLVGSDTGTVTLAIDTYSAGNGGAAQGALTCSNTGFPTVAAVAGVVTFTSCQITGSAGAGTYTLQASRGGLTATGASNNVAINAGALNGFTFALATPQTAGTAFTGTDTLTAQDAFSNTVTSFNASTTNVTVTAGSGLNGTISFATGASGAILNGVADFVNGVADLSSAGLGMKISLPGAGTFTATASAKTGASGTVMVSAPNGITGIEWTGVTKPSGSAISCTGAGTNDYSCTISGGGNNSSAAAQIEFVNSSGTATVYSTTLSETVTVAYASNWKSSGPTSMSVAAGSSASTGTAASGTASGAKTAVMTATFGGFTATLTVKP